jgi:hypothetical protein
MEIPTYAEDFFRKFANTNYDAIVFLKWMNSMKIFLIGYYCEWAWSMLRISFVKLFLPVAGRNSSPIWDLCVSERTRDCEDKQLNSIISSFGRMQWTSTKPRRAFPWLLWSHLSKYARKVTHRNKEEIACHFGRGVSHPETESALFYPTCFRQFLE